MSTAITEGEVRNDFSVEKPDWAKVKGESYNVDHVINAYLSGQEKALNRFSNQLKKISEQNLIEGMELLDSLTDQLKEKLDVEFVQVRLGQNDLNILKAIIILSKEIFLSDKIDAVYDLYFEFQDELETDFDFNVNFTFADKNINYEQMSLDGYQYFRRPS